MLRTSNRPQRHQSCFGTPWTDWKERAVLVLSRPLVVGTMSTTESMDRSAPDRGATPRIWCNEVPILWLKAHRRRGSKESSHLSGQSDLNRFVLVFRIDCIQHRWAGLMSRSFRKREFSMFRLGLCSPSRVPCQVIA